MFLTLKDVRAKSGDLKFNQHQLTAHQTLQLTGHTNLTTLAALFRSTTAKALSRPPSVVFRHQAAAPQLQNMRVKQHRRSLVSHSGLKQWNNMAVKMIKLPFFP